MAASRNAPHEPARLQWPDGYVERVRLQSLGKSGGAGEVYSVEGHPGLVAKVYHDAIRAAHGPRYAHKLDWMIAHPPELPPMPAGTEDVVQLAWPVARVLHGSAFAGFAMRKIDFERTLELDYLLTRRQAQAEGFEADYGKLVTICCNLASLIHCLHSRRIAVVDLKPINLKVYKSELYVSILDCDGFHIAAEGFVAEAPQVTPEYLAPEFHGHAVSHPLAQDEFALATIVFRLLNYGIHPYAGVPVGRLAYPSELAARIERGLYPYGRTAHPQVRTAPASVHDCLPDDLRALFDRSLVPGPYGRASAHEWSQALGRYASRAAANLHPCAQGHLQFSGKACATCAREQLLRGATTRRRLFLQRLQASPARAVTYMRRSFQGTYSSPFQAALAQVQLNTVQLATPNLPLRQVVAVEILWTLGLLATWWWLR